MMDVMGTVYESLGLYSKAESLYKSATETRRGSGKSRHPGFGE